MAYTYSGKDFVDYVSPASPGTPLNETNLDTNGLAIDEIQALYAKVAAGQAQIAGTLNVTGAVDFDSNANIDGALTVDGISTLAGNVSTGGTLTTSGKLTVSGAGSELAGDIKITGIDTGYKGLYTDSDEGQFIYSSSTSFNTGATVQLNGEDRGDDPGDLLLLSGGSIDTFAQVRIAYRDSGGITDIANFNSDLSTQLFGTLTTVGAINAGNGATGTFTSVTVVNGIVTAGT